MRSCWKVYTIVVKRSREDDFRYHGRFDAANRKTKSSDLESPSICTSNSVFILRLPSCSPLQKEWFQSREGQYQLSHVEWLLWTTHYNYAWNMHPIELEETKFYLPPEAEPRWLMRASNSSRNIVDGAWKRANSNRTWNWKGVLYWTKF